MNNGYYYSYIVNSGYYRNLSNAISLIGEITNDIGGLKTALADASGDIINEMVTDLNSLQLELSKYKNTASNIQRDLKENAKMFDVALENWKNKVGTITERGYKCGTLMSSYIPDGMPSNYKNALAYKYSIKIDNVSVDTNDNAICIRYLVQYNGYEIMNPGIFTQVGWKDILKEQNRNTSRDYSNTVTKKIDFSSKSDGSFKIS